MKYATAAQLADAHPSSKHNWVGLQVVKWFWEVVHSLPQEQQKQFLFFVTGSDRVPIKGLASLTPPFTISRAGPHSDRLPTAHTCFNHLLLPDYQVWPHARIVHLMPCWKAEAVVMGCFAPSMAVQQWFITDAAAITSMSGFSDVLTGCRDCCLWVEWRVAGFEVPAWSAAAVDSEFRRFRSHVMWFYFCVNSNWIFCFFLSMMFSCAWAMYH